MSANRSIAAGAALLLVGSLAPMLAAPPQRDAERGVRRTLIRLNQLLADRDPAIVDEFVDSPDTLLVGSLANDRARGRAELEAHFRGYFERPDTLSFAWREVDVAVRGAVAWLHAEGEVIVHGEGGDKRGPYRLTAVLELHAGKWLWRLFHGSQPAG
ncbi:nuclear transport factor 2 family protein [Phenylobacterium sp.]|uniref:nuclear transport factor 2 family protein n=1 Tax=Phenylobacterium sp. TaxID=1871053 RepID=UPI002DF0F31F|nr:nuclear transport factor 2 family protein [Phenylobacterium sp.]